MTAAGDWAGRHLGERLVGYDERDAILYALAVGARPDELDGPCTLAAIALGLACTS